MTRSSRTPRIEAFIALGVVAGALVFSACSSPRSEASAPPSETVHLAPLTSGILTPAATDAPTDATADSVPVTEAVPATDAASTTSTLPANQVFVGSFPGTIVPVGNADGADTAVIQLRLIQLGFWNSQPNGKYGLTTKQAVMAFQKYSGIEATGLVDAATAAAILALEVKGHGTADTGTLIEVDKVRQLLFVVVDGVTQWVLNASTGNGLPFDEPDKNSPGARNITGVALTPDGLWKVDRERVDGWWKGDLGDIYRPKYFHNGIAVHGANSVPNYPASHGCVRVSVPAMDFIWANNIMPRGIHVWVHS